MLLSTGLLAITAVDQIIPDRVSAHVEVLMLGLRCTGAGIKRFGAWHDPVRWMNMSGERVLRYQLPDNDETR